MNWNRDIDPKLLKKDMDAANKVMFWIPLVKFLWKCEILIDKLGKEYGVVIGKGYKEELLVCGTRIYRTYGFGDEYLALYKFNERVGRFIEYAMKRNPF